MSWSFQNKVALVTGAGSGMGLATARAFAAAGAAVTLADAKEDAVRSAASELVAAGHKALAVQCDVTDDTQVAAMIDRTVAEFGRLDAAFNNAGIMTPAVELADVTREVYDRVTAINLRGVWSCMKYELLQMRQQGSGVIVNNSSIGGLIGIPGEPLPRDQARGDWADAERGAGVRRTGHPDQRRVSGDYRHADGRGDVRQGAGGDEGRLAGYSDRASGPAGGDRRRRPVAVQPGGGLRDRPRPRHRRRLHGALRIQVNGRATRHKSASMAVTVRSRHDNWPLEWFDLRPETPRPGLEPGTNRLTAGCSTIELSRNDCLSCFNRRLLEGQEDSAAVIDFPSPIARHGKPARSYCGYRASL